MMKRKILFIMLSVFVIASLAGCKERQQSKKPKEQTLTETEQSVSEDTKKDDETVEETLQQNSQETSKEEKGEGNLTVKTEQTDHKVGAIKNPSNNSGQNQTEQETPQTPTPQTPTTETPKEENKVPVPEVPKETANDSVAVANKVIEYINSFRSSPATKLPGLTKYAEYRSKQLIRKFAHDTADERAAATALQYGSYIDPTLYGMTGEPYYVAGAREAIAKGGYVGTVDEVAQRLATLVKNSAGHWAYVGSNEYPYIAVGVTYESGMWYCDIAMARENTDNN